MSSTETIEIRPLAARDEAFALLRFLVLVYALLFLALWGRIERGGEELGLFPFQLPFGELSQSDQRMYRQLREGIAELVRYRSMDGAWPPVALLESAGVPPFAEHPLDAGAYHWSLRLEGRSIRYLGSAAPGRSSFLVTIAEPDPRAPDVTHLGMKALDELHRRLDDGTILDLGVWLRPGPAPARVLDPPMNQDWKQIVASPPGDSTGGLP